MKNIISTFTLLMLFSLIFGACSKDEDEVIISEREEISGTYTWLDGGNGLPVSADFEVSVDPSHPEKIIFLFKDAGYSFHARALERNPQIIHFRIPPQFTTVSGFPFATQGQELVNVGEDSYQGVYFRDTKEIRMGVKLSIVNTSGQEITGTSTILKGKRKP